MFSIINQEGRTVAKKDLNKAESGERKAEEQTGEQQLGTTMGLDVGAESVTEAVTESPALASSPSPSASAISPAPHDEADAEAPVNVMSNGGTVEFTLTEDLGQSVDAAFATRPSPPSPRPSCARHHVQMRAVSSPEHVTYYACPVPGCDQTDKRSRKAAAIPTEPKACPMRTCQASGEPGSHPQYLEVDERKTKGNPALIVLVCPQCGFELKTPRPGVFDRVQRVREREASDDFAAR